MLKENKSNRSAVQTVVIYAPSAQIWHTHHLSPDMQMSSLFDRKSSLQYLLLFLAFFLLGYPVRQASVLYEILDKIEDQEFTLRHPRDGKHKGDEFTKLEKVYYHPNFMSTLNTS